MAVGLVAVVDNAVVAVVGVVGVVGVGVVVQVLTAAMEAASSSWEYHCCRM